MKRVLLILALIFSLLLCMSLPVTASITQGNTNIQEDDTNVMTEKGTFTVALNSSTGTFQVNLSLYKGTTYVTSSYVTAQSNGTKSLTLPSMDGSTVYQIRIRANDTSSPSLWHNTSVNFTTGVKRLTEDTTNFSAGEIIIIGLILTVIILGFMYGFIKDIRKEKLNLDKLVKQLVLIIVFIVVIVVIASFI